jgi:transposase
MAKMGKPPEIITVSAEQLDAALAEVQSSVSEGTYQIIENAVRTMRWLLDMVEKQRLSLKKLKRMIFGAASEKLDKLSGKGGQPDGSKDAPPANPQGGPKPDQDDPVKKDKEDKKTRRKGHGRLGVNQYFGAKRILVPHPTLKTGCLCPRCSTGSLYECPPARILRIKAEPLFMGACFNLERVRCSGCGALFTAPPPPEAGSGKYDESVGVMLAIARYGMGLPMSRVETWQRHFGVPMPSGTQWDLIRAAAEEVEVAFESLEVTAAQGQVVYNDDTTMRVQDLVKEIAQAEEKDPKARTGIFTTGIVAEVGEHRVALFYTGNRHAGENLDDLLKQRADGLEPPLQMCDGLDRNVPKGFETILCNCIPHGRRNFVDILSSFPESCGRVLKSLAEVYRIDEQAKNKGLSPQDRLAFHQQHSRPVMDELHRWMKEQIDQKKVEPNSGLGQAIGYMLKRWESLTRFLSVAGAPLDNNICERALKMAIRHRKNSLSYKTARGARVGDLFMSLLHTSALNQVNPFKYLTALVKHSSEVRKEPLRWLPWSYRAALAEIDPDDTS